ncbi:probable 18S rRNA (guanine-N(7))-methyltransferase [Paramacrobiotus metropolitanus]|uniref:probable 18S rRNA (guanine-N(7))-methyltransferase n=1 Tax=Paramacrobiotus metropolitanus TaxID=2943436 RepID=UPI0024464FEC|nr:probable 18S rRNA (guanine-N(7))-methyltransferase [Paramacrobiotus metropolitanus]
MRDAASQQRTDLASVVCVLWIFRFSHYGEFAVSARLFLCISRRFSILSALSAVSADSLCAKGTKSPAANRLPLFSAGNRKLSFEMAGRGRPEYHAPPEIFYNDDEARKYTSNSRIMGIQVELAERALELLSLPEGNPCYLLDLGCGSGLSGETITNAGHFWVGMDISSSMLDVAGEREVDGDLLLSDLGEGLPFRPGSFDGAIRCGWMAIRESLTLLRDFLDLYFQHLGVTVAVQCRQKRAHPFEASRGSKAVFQFYPENSAQVELITQQSMRAGFTGGLVVDYPNSARAKKMYLVLFTGGVNPTLPKGLDGAGEKPVSNRSGHVDSRPSKPQKNTRKLIF